MGLKTRLSAYCANRRKNPANLVTSGKINETCAPSYGRIYALKTTDKMKLLS